MQRGFSRKSNHAHSQYLYIHSTDAIDSTFHVFNYFMFHLSINRNRSSPLQTKTYWSRETTASQHKTTSKTGWMRLNYMFFFFLSFVVRSKICV
mmetsp:Transcript_24791/g.58170  ORF Transcript_24791/g.58170 Transcript_24791/m.58170 type:complete len:94 (+) Transcript_24791:1856-2137(+)